MEEKQRGPSGLPQGEYLLALGPFAMKCSLLSIFHVFVNRNFQNLPSAAAFTSVLGTVPLPLPWHSLCRLSLLIPLLSQEFLLALQHLGGGQHSAAPF